MDEKYPYQRQWEEYRKLRNRQYIVFLGGGLLLNLIGYFGGLLGLNSGVNSTIQLALLVIWIITLIYVVFHFYNWKCPNCNRRFFVSSFWIRSPEFLSNCRNCDLQKYAGSTFEKN